MPNAADIRRQVEKETEHRSRLSVPSFAGGFLYLLSAIVIASTLNGAPTVGLFQGLAPTLSGIAHPAVSPRAAEVKFISSHAFPLIAGSFVAAIAVGVLTLMLLVLLDATVFRRPGVWSAARPLILGGGIAVAVASVAHQLVAAVETHNFASGHDFTSHAVDQALTKATPNLVIAYLSLFAGLALAAGMITVMINALRVGLIPRWLGIVGMFTALLIFLPLGGAELQVVPAFWMVMVGMLFAQRWPKGDPAAWLAGEARPWPTRAQMQAERAGRDPQAHAKASAAAPAATPMKASSRKRRKRGGRS
jgi:hypothetical protein